MIINKITNGFVVQSFDTELGKFINQEFIAEKTAIWEDPYGDEVDDPDTSNTLLFQMVQPLPMLATAPPKEDIVDPDVIAGWHCEDGGVIEPPDIAGVMFRRDKTGRVVETRWLNNSNYGDWLALFDTEDTRRITGP